MWKVDGSAWFILQSWGARWLPGWLEPVFVAGYVSLFFFLCAAPRNAVRHNLAALFPSDGRIRLTLRAWLVFLRFGATATEAMQCRLGRNLVDWEISGRVHFEEIVASPTGCILLTAHMGSSDVAATAFAGRFPRRLTAVRAPVRHASTQREMHRQLVANASSTFEVIYNAHEFVGVELVQRLAAGEAVALQGDRVLFDVASMEVVRNGLGLILPKGPFALALATGVPIFPLFVVRLGRRCYRVEVGAPFFCEGRREERAVAMKQAAAHWFDLLVAQARRHWDQWYIFEPALKRISSNLEETPVMLLPAEIVPESPDRCATSLAWLLLKLRPVAVSGDTNDDRRLVFRLLQSGQNAWENTLICLLVCGTIWALLTAFLCEIRGWSLIPALFAGIPGMVGCLHGAFFAGSVPVAAAGFLGLKSRDPSRWVGVLILAGITAAAFLSWIQGGGWLKLAASPWLGIFGLNVIATGIRTVSDLLETLAGKGPERS